MATVPPYALVWALVVFARVARCLVRMALAVLLPPIMADLRISYTRAGLLATAI